MENRGELTGKMLAGYELGERVGSGGMATVYLAQQKSIGRKVAIKVMPTHLMNDPTFLQRFKKEVEVIAALQHPRVLPVYDYGEIDMRPYIVMAYIDGGTLGDLIAKGPMPTNQIQRLIGQIAEGLDHAHRQGVIHRDFKPSNVLLDSNGNSYLADFGIAKLSEQATNLTGSGVIGTPAYMAPEMAQSGDLANTVDIYALGVTLYEMLTGKYPFEADTAIRMMMAHVSEPVPDVVEQRPELPNKVGDVVAKAMAKAPEDRYTTAMALSRDLANAFAGRPVKAPPRDSPRARPSTMGGTVAIPPGERPKTTAPEPEEEAKAEQQSSGGRGGLLTPVLIGGGLLLAAVACVAVLFLTGALDSLTGAGTAGSVEVINETSIPLCALRVESAPSSAWGANQLATVGQIEPGDSYTVLNVPFGDYDLRVEDCDGSMINELYATSITGNNTWTISEAELRVINESSEELCVINISSPQVGSWGSNRLSSGTLAPGAEQTFLLAEGTWDLRAAPCDTSIDPAVQEGADISGTIDWTISDN